MPSLVDSFRELASTAILSIVSRQTDESQADVARGFSAAIPAMAATIANRADDRDFMITLTDLATKATMDSDPLKGIGRIVSASNGIDTTTPSGGFLSSLFGHNLSSMVDSLANYAGIRGSSAASILSVSAPLVLGYLGRLIRNENLSSAGLSERLRSHRNQLAAAVPLGFDMPLFSSSRAARAGVDDAARSAAHRHPERLSWGVPLLALLGLLGLGGLIWRASHKPATIENARVEVQAPGKSVGTTGMSRLPAIGTTGVVPGRLTRALPGNTSITVPAGSAEDRLANYLASAAPGRILIGFDRITFDTGSAVLSSDAREQIDNIATILRAYPKASVMVAGYTDNTGNEAANVTLSRARAEAIGSRLTAQGVAADRLRAEGYGSQNPLADNATEAGRRQNRRVQLEVDAK
jgi:OOP family OmpA-OmpF porin